MVISDENYYPILIDSIHTPLLTDYFWVLDLKERDFFLTELKVLEEHITPILVFKIMGYAFEIPADWNIMIYSKDTSQLDIAEASEICRGDFSSLVYDHQKDRVVEGPVHVIDYKPREYIHVPSLNKTQMLCHALGPKHWICISPTDNYNKYLKNAVLGDIIH